ncbi:HlyD family secretion protein [Novipirellula artificiosorum]|uniref:Inner membrane protein YiaV n=1 Tax=Novipirellula artificiosorum TaxID=2528016 RepID=A0A5C6CVW6_9BACT|nr:biotin/lipoyl-binding protein [Novipirellula artificiosorum]TWU27975.1 Inner membrane protein YiaV precursor [Novipirellula artificiosorum]
MSWILGAAYCFVIWLIFAKLRLIRLSLPLAIIAGSVGPLLIVALLFCAQYFHPFSSSARVFKKTIPVIAQLNQRGQVIEVVVEPNRPVKKGDVLFRVDRVPYETLVKQLIAAVEAAKQGKQVAESSVILAEASLERANADLKFATAQRDRQEELLSSNATSEADYDLAVTRYSEANAAVSQATAALTQASQNVGLAATKIEQAESQLADAQYDLEHTTVVAPGYGYVTNLQLIEGMVVGKASGPTMSFILDEDEDNRGVVVAGFNQKNYLRIKEGQYSEVALFGYPGQIFKGRVVNTIDMSGTGQLQASGNLPTTLGSQAPTQFAVKIKLDDDSIRLPGGSQAIVAVYTEDVQIAGIPVMFVIRAQSWLRYLM